MVGTGMRYHVAKSCRRAAAGFSSADFAQSEESMLVVGVVVVSSLVELVELEELEELEGGEGKGEMETLVSLLFPLLLNPNFLFPPPR